MKTYNIDRDCATGATYQCLYWLIICQTLFQPVLDCKTLLFDLKIITVTGFHFPMFMLVSTLSMRPLSTPRDKSYIAYENLNGTTYSGEPERLLIENKNAHS